MKYIPASYIPRRHFSLLGVARILPPFPLARRGDDAGSPPSPQPQTLGPPRAHGPPLSRSAPTFPFSPWVPSSWSPYSWCSQTVGPLTGSGEVSDRVGGRPGTERAGRRRAAEARRGANRAVAQAHRGAGSRRPGSALGPTAAIVLGCLDLKACWAELQRKEDSAPKTTPPTLR